MPTRPSGARAVHELRVSGVFEWRQGGATSDPVQAVPGCILGRFLSRERSGAAPLLPEMCWRCGVFFFQASFEDSEEDTCGAHCPHLGLGSARIV